MVSNKKIHRAWELIQLLWTIPIREIFHFQHLPKLYFGFNCKYLELCKIRNLDSFYIYCIIFCLSLLCQITSRKGAGGLMSNVLDSNNFWDDHVAFIPLHVHRTHGLAHLQEIQCCYWHSIWEFRGDGCELWYRWVFSQCYRKIVSIKMNKASSLLCIWSLYNVFHILTLKGPGFFVYLKSGGGGGGGGRKILKFGRYIELVNTNVLTKFQY